MTGQAAPTHPHSDVGPREYTVSELAAAVQQRVEAVGRVRLKGEVSGFKRAGSGHLYFDLKDANAVIAAVCWRSSAARIRTQPEDGLEVVVSGKLTTYPGRSQYQIVVDSVTLAGAGALLKLLEDRRRKLAAEGMFDAARKQPLPYLPEVVGVVTSPSGAVLRDILHRLRDRFPRRVLVWPVPVQGDGAAAAVANAIEGFGRLSASGAVPRPGVLIVARGGGSAEDLMAFNEEEVVRAAAACPIPVISAVGHETDITLLDFAADVRAPTPTAAAEMAVPVRAELAVEVRALGARLSAAAARSLAQRSERLAGLARGLRGPREWLDRGVQRLDHAALRLGSVRAAAHARWVHRFELAAGRLTAAQLAGRLDAGAERLAALSRSLARDMGRGLTERGRALTGLAGVLESVSHKRVLQRGYAVLWDADARPVTRAAAVSPGMALDIELRDGHVPATAGKGAAAPPRRRKRTDDGAEEPEPLTQGKLL